MLAAGRALRLRKLIGLGPINPALGGEEQDPVVCRAHEEVPHHVVLLERGSLDALPAALLTAVEVGLGALGVAGLGDGDDDLFAGDEVLVGDVALGGDDAGEAIVAVLLGDLGEFVTHDDPLALRLGQDVLEVGDLLLDLGQIVDDLLPFQGRQPAQLHVEDGLRLDLVDVEQLDQAGACDVDRLRGADQRDHLVERIERLDQAAQDVGPLVGLAQPVGGPPDDHIELVLDVVADHLVQPQGSRHPVDDRQHVGAEAGLQLGVLIEVVQHHLGHGVTLDLDDDAQAHPVAGLVLDVGDAGQLALAHLVGNRGDEVVVVDLIRQFGDDDRGAAPGVLFDFHDAAHPDRTAAGGVGIDDALGPDDQAGGGEVRALDPFDHRREGGLLVGVEVLQAPVDRLGQLAQVVRRDVGGHTDGDTAGTVGQQIGEPARQDGGLLHPPVVVGREIDCLLVDFAQHLHRQRGEASLCVPHGSRWIVAR